MAAGRKTGGRTKGSLNKSTAEIKILAQQHGEAAINRLAELMISAESEQAQIAAAKELLDRGYGKSVQAVELGGSDGRPLNLVVKFGAN